MANFIPFNRDQAFLLPPDLKSWLPDDDLAHFVVAAVERVPLATFVVPTRTGGKPQYHPRLMLALLIHCYANGLFSSRRIEQPRVAIQLLDTRRTQRIRHAPTGPSSICEVACCQAWQGCLRAIPAPLRPACSYITGSSLPGGQVSIKLTLQTNNDGYIFMSGKR